MTEVTSNEDRARKLVVEHLGVETDKVTADADFADDLGADSLDMIELVMAFEEEFNIEIADDEGDKVKTFSDAMTLLDAKTNRGKA
jgi:acyl carrier protein